MINDFFANNYQKLLKVAYDICKDKDLSNDLVNDAYIKLHQIDKEINIAYVYFTIRSIYFNQLKENKLIFLDEIPDYLIKEINEYNSKNDLKIDVTLSELSKLKTHEKIIIEHSTEDGLRKFERESGISIRTVVRCKKKLKNKVEQAMLSLQSQPQSE